jgi:hypothetical protein
MLATATTCCMTSTMSPLEGAADGSGSSYYLDKEGIDGWPPRGAASRSGSIHH